MIQILVVDDDPHKTAHIRELLSRLPEIELSSISTASDLVAARDTLAKKYFDLLILDIRIPAAAGEEPSEAAGMQFVRELGASGTLIKPAHIIGITAFDAAFNAADETFVDEVWRIIRYDPTKETWQRQLTAKVNYLVRSKRELMTGENAGYSFDLGIVTALRKPELQAILDLPVDWQARKFSNDATEYFVASCEKAGRRLRVAAACASQMGMGATAVVAMKIIGHFRPRFLCMSGMAAGIKSEGIGLGDILIGDQCWDYESGKKSRTADGKMQLLPDPRSIPLRADLKEAFTSSIGRDAHVDEISRSWRGNRPSTPLRAAMGPLASGASVIEDPAVVADIKRHARKLIGIDMESYALFFAGENCSKPRPAVFTVKSAADFADSDKDDDFQEFASFTSAQYIWRFCQDNLMS
jgi:nucleoside phosphorylase